MHHFLSEDAILFMNLCLSHDCRVEGLSKTFYRNGFSCSTAHVSQVCWIDSRLRSRGGTSSSTRMQVLRKETQAMSVQTVSYVEAIEHLPKGATLRIPAVSWEDYEALLAELGDAFHVRVSYNSGCLDIMSPLPEHEEFGEVIQDIAREITRTLGLKLEARGSMTMRNAWQRKGAEPDTCFYIQNAERIIGKRSLDFTIDPTPDVIVEIDITNAAQAKFPIYAALSVPEIWCYDGATASFYVLEGAAYVATAHSRAFPFLPSTVLAQWLEQSKTAGQDATLDAVRAWVQDRQVQGENR